MDMIRVFTIFCNSGVLHLALQANVPDMKLDVGA